MMKIFGFVLWVLTFFWATGFAAAQNNVAPQEPGHHVFAFFEIGDSVNDPDNTISFDDFVGIIEELKRGHYTVAPIASVLASVTGDFPVISLTFDGGYRSFYENALPALKQSELPFTVFITPEQINRNSPRFMTWEQIREVADLDYATVALQADYYVPLPVRDDSDIRTGLNRGIGIFEQNLGYKPSYIAYPFGMYDEKTLSIISEYDFIKAGFGLNSSVIAPQTPRLTLPRFALTGDYADVNRFKMVAGALPMPVFDTIPGRSTIVDKDAPDIGFSVQNTVTNLDKLSCFAGGYGRIKPEILGNRVELRFDQPLIEGVRLRINCTLPTISPEDGTENWYWYGILIQPR